MLIWYLDLIKLLIWLCYFKNLLQGTFQWGLLSYRDYYTYLQCGLVEWFPCGVSLYWKVYFKNSASSLNLEWRFQQSFSITCLWVVLNGSYPYNYILLTKPLLFVINDLLTIFTWNFLWVSNGVTIILSNSMALFYIQYLS